MIPFRNELISCTHTKFDVMKSETESIVSIYKEVLIYWFGGPPYSDSEPELQGEPNENLLANRIEPHIIRYPKTVPENYVPSQQNASKRGNSKKTYDSTTWE